MKFDSQEQKDMVIQIVSGVQITTSVANLPKATTEMQALLKAVTDAEVADAVQEP